MTPNRRTATAVPKRRIGTVLALLLLLGLVVPPAAAVATSTSTSSGTRSTATWAHRPKPTVVLVHGAWADASSWSRVVVRLESDGYRVVAPPNPLRGLTVDSAYLTSYLSTITGPIVLVGHSYGGAVITNAATGNPNVKALVYVDAFAPAAGETLQQLVGAQPGSALAADPTTIFDFVPYPGAAHGDVDLYLKASVFHDDFAGDLSRRHAAELAATQRPLVASAIGQPSGVPAWQHLPSWYLVGAEDRVIPEAEQLAMAHRARSHITVVHASHASLISRPAAVEHLVVQAANAAGR